MSVRIDLNEPKIVKKVKNDRLGTFLASEWKRLIDPYTPRDTGQLENVAKIMPFKLHYKSKYAKRRYYERNVVFRKENPYSTYEWDKAAEQAGQKNKLCRAANAALKSGQY